MKIMSNEISTREIDAFRHFLLKLPHGKDIVLVILKGQLLIEEQVKQIVKQRVSYFSVLNDARLSFSQQISLAHALVGNEVDPWIWSSLKKIGALRNKIAHEMEADSLTKEIEKFINSVPGLFENTETQDQLELKLWLLFANVSALVEKKKEY
jgi:vacuolar-type H+-ATPase subunit I/STV1